MKNAKDFKPGINPDPKTPPPPGNSKGSVVFPTLPDPRGEPKYRYATCIEVFQNGNKVMSFYDGAMKIVTESKDYIVFYDKYGRRTTIYNNDGIIFVQYKPDKE